MAAAGVLCSGGARLGSSRRRGNFPTYTISSSGLAVLFCFFLHLCYMHRGVVVGGGPGAKYKPAWLELGDLGPAVLHPSADSVSNALPLPTLNLAR